ncbi:alpha/beta fold hydrolase [Vineibacter terrae]|uniref:bifunctional alpha/beta hydrolase/OsmC family protein n=1 Tax=Vineibacter terrae TaxID=2586908 RepID=UPI002E34523E|nr:alpha/beta fold hydrolase [Vineibacter terrae]HEX2885816.1 alpha/beta fold hydrolase [Vineibacter terrae]
MPAQRFDFPNARGERLAALLDLPEAPPRAYALFAHCFTCGKDVLAASRIAQGLTRLGIAVLRFDFTGLGASDGEFANTNFSSNVADLIAAADHLRRTHAAPQLLIGHSLGGAAVLAAAGDIAEVRAVATIGAPSDPGHITHLFRDRLADIAAQGEVEVMLAGRPFRVQRQFLEDVAGQRLSERVAHLRRALLVLHAPTDDTVGIENASAIFGAARHPKSFVSLDDADHLLRRPRDAAYAANVIAAWVERYLTPAAAPDAGDDAPVDGVRVQETGGGRFQQHVAIGRHRLRADEPVASGGLDSGPDPYGLLLAALGACTSMTLRLYAERKQLPLERVSVHLRHTKIHAADCDECETKSGRLDRIDREIVLQGTLDDATRKRLLEIADMCPVHRTLTSEVLIKTSERAIDPS